MGLLGLMGPGECFVKEQRPEVEIVEGGDLSIVYSYTPVLYSY